MLIIIKIAIMILMIGKPNDCNNDNTDNDYNDSTNDIDI